MEIISHRGYWLEDREKNSEPAFRRSFGLGFGTETDIRDLNGELVVSHDIAKKGCLSLEKLFDFYKSEQTKPLLALNIKADGLQKLLQKSLKKNNIQNYFVFDMSFPDTFSYFREGMNFFIRQSEYERRTSLYEEASGIWLDAFDSIWYSQETVKKHLENGKKVAIVSSELHRREHLEHWTLLKSWGITNHENLILCTDFPEEAANYFYND